MTTLTIEQIQEDVSAFLKKIEDGEDMVILKDGQVMAEVSTISPPIDKKGQRPFGLCKGEIIMTDDFNDPLPDEIVDAFYK